MVSFHGGGTPIARWTAGSYRRRLMFDELTMKKILKWIVGIVLYIFLVILFVDGRHWLESRFREDDGVKIELLRSASI